MLVAIVVAAVAACAAAGAAPKGTSSLVTMPGVNPPVLTVTHAAKNVAPGYVFVAEKKGGSPGGPVIADNKGRVVWFHSLPDPVQATDFRVQTYRGKPVLTWWQGKISKAGVGQGYGVIMDSAYRVIARVHAAHGLQSDLHEFELTPRGTAYVTAYKEVAADLSSVGGPTNGWVLDSFVQEINVRTGHVVFEWHSLGHVPLSDSREANHEPAKDASKKRPFDYFHVNSISDGPNGTILISARNTSTLYDLSRSGEIVWQFGGLHSDFGPTSAVKLNYQHNARLHPGGLLTVFDNGAIPKAEPYTRPMEIKLDLSKKTARIVKTFVHPQKLLSPYEGDIQLLANADAFVGWGGIRRVSEFSPSGKLIFEMKLPYGDSYRGFRFPWAGKPDAPPAVVVKGSTVYASWNGRTGIARWQVLSGASVVASKEWSGLETAIPVSSTQNIQVRALDAAGRVLVTVKPTS